MSEQNETDHVFDTVWTSEDGVVIGSSSQDIKDGIIKFQIDPFVDKPPGVIRIDLVGWPVNPQGGSNKPSTRALHEVLKGSPVAIDFKISHKDAMTLGKWLMKAHEDLQSFEGDLESE